MCGVVVGGVGLCFTRGVYHHQLVVIIAYNCYGYLTPILPHPLAHTSTTHV